MRVLESKKLTIGYPNKVIAADINLVLEPGTLVCLLGQNGVGKSTLLRTLANLQDPLSGEVCLGGENVSSIDKGELAKQLGIITTDKIGTSNMTVRELVALGRYPYTNWLGKESNTDTAMIEEAISRCKINYIQESKLSAISDGQFQKVMVARALAQDTDVILMDEPTAHLDVVNRVEMFKLLQDIKRDTGKSILISTHELDISMQFSDQLWLMNFNVPLVAGSPEDLGMSGEIDRIFFHDDFKIDLKTGGILIDHKPGLKFSLQGDDSSIYWVSRSLKRCGFELSNDGVEIKLTSSNDQLIWTLQNRKGSTIAHLMEECAKIKLTSKA